MRVTSLLLKLVGMATAANPLPGVDRSLDTTMGRGIEWLVPHRPISPAVIPSRRSIPYQFLVGCRFMESTTMIFDGTLAL